jgi:hypothetical protein
VRPEPEEAECSNGHKLIVDRDADGVIVAAAEQVNLVDTWRFVSCAFCPTCGAEIVANR